MRFRELTLLTVVYADVKYTRCQAIELQQKFNFTVTDDVIVDDIDCINRAVDAATVELGSPDLWTHNLENGFYIVPYFFDANHTEEEKSFIRLAASNFQESTCIRLREIGSTEIYYNRRLRLTRDEGCWSFVGALSTTRASFAQQLNLGPDCVKVNCFNFDFIT